MAKPFTPEQRQPVVRQWRDSGLPVGDCAAPIGLKKTSLYRWVGSARPRWRAQKSRAPRAPVRRRSSTSRYRQRRRK